MRRINRIEKKNPASLEGESPTKSLVQSGKRIQAPMKTKTMQLPTPIDAESINELQFLLDEYLASNPSTYSQLGRQIQHYLLLLR